MDRIRSHRKVFMVLTSTKIWMSMAFPFATVLLFKFCNNTIYSLRSSTCCQGFDLTTDSYSECLRNNHHTVAFPTDLYTAVLLDQYSLSYFRKGFHQIVHICHGHQLGRFWSSIPGNYELQSRLWGDMWYVQSASPVGNRTFQPVPIKLD